MKPIDLRAELAIICMDSRSTAGQKVNLILETLASMGIFPQASTPPPESGKVRAEDLRDVLGRIQRIAKTATPTDLSYMPGSAMAWENAVKAEIATLEAHQGPTTNPKPIPAMESEA